MDITLQKGLSTELQCIQDFIKLGYFCSIPYGDSCRYDVIVDINNILYRIQCKTSSWCKDTAQEKVAFSFECRTSTSNTKGITRKTYSEEEVDFFYTCFEGESYLIPISEIAGKSSFRLRYEYPSNNQKQGVHIANDYLLEKQIQSFVKEEVVE